MDSYSSSSNTRIERKQAIQLGNPLGSQCAVSRHKTFNLEREQSQRIRFRIEAGIIRFFYRKIQFQKHYIQLEVGMHQFHTRLYNPDYELRKINTSAYTLDVPILYGYNITKHGPYLMNLFAGPRVSYIFNETSGISTTGGSFRNLIYDESPNSFSFYLIGGLSTTIGHLYIDFRYAYCVGNSKDLSFKVNPDELQTSQVKLSRAVNELSISIGYLW